MAKPVASEGSQYAAQLGQHEDVVALDFKGCFVSHGAEYQVRQVPAALLLEVDPQSEDP